MSGKSNLLLQLETKCGSLLYELQIIWDEVGECDGDRETILLELEQECLEVYRRKVDQANKSRAQLRQAIADAEADLAAICSAMGERSVHIRQSDQNTGSLKAELRAILPQVDEMRKRKCERRNQFMKVLEDIQSIKIEIDKSEGYAFKEMVVDETDLSLRKLEELDRELQALQREKSERLKQVMELLNYLYLMCSVIGLDFKQTIAEIHPSLGESESPKHISNSTIEKLGTAIQRLRDVKLQRMQQLQDLATSLLELWNLMDTPIEDQQIFQKATCNIAASEDEITEPDMLSADFINYVKAEVSRLEELKISKMKELVLKKRVELEEICRKTHIIPASESAIDIDTIESGAVDASYLLEQIEIQLSRIKDEAFSRKEILERVEKWMNACEEESWLEEYNRDDNRYNAGRGAHLTLKRAEKARALVNKIPVTVDTLTAKTIAWENDNGIAFTYDGVRLLSMLEGYTALRQEKELELKRQRDQKKFQGQLLTEQETLYGSKPSPMKNPSMKKGGPILSCGGVNNRRLSLGFPSSTKATPSNAKKSERLNQDRLRDDGSAALSSGRRGLDLAGLPVKQNFREIESPMMRKPFSPISSTDSSKSNATNILEDLNKRQHEMLHMKTLFTSNNITFTSPSKMLCTSEQENRTPQNTAMVVPSTPSSILLIPMQTALTPAPMKPAFLNSASTPATLAVKSVNENIEYSFEERRAGFVLP